MRATTACAGRPGSRSSRWRAGARSARSARARAGARSSCPITLTLIAFLPAFAVLAIRAIVGQSFADRFPELIPYRQYLTEIGLTVTIFAAILCPELLCPDRRDNVLSLYLSTAVGRLTYVVGKFLAALVPLLCLTLLPVLLLFVGNTFFADSATSYLADHWLDFFRDPRLRPAAGVVRQPGRARGRVVHEPARVRARRLRGADADPDLRRRRARLRRRPRPPPAADHARPPADRRDALALPGRPGSRRKRWPAGGGGPRAASSWPSPLLCLWWRYRRADA